MTHPQIAPAEEVAQPVRRGPGRPRRIGTEERAYRAVLELFGQKGWAGLSLDAVAHHARVGKSSVYLRWSDKRDLLLEALRDLETRHVNPPEELPIREYLIAHARGRGELMLGEQGPAIAAIVSASVANPVEFAEIVDESIKRGFLALSGRIQMAIDDGELSPATSVSHVVALIEGAIYFHVLVSPEAPGIDKDLRAGLEAFCTHLVDMLLGGLLR